MTVGELIEKLGEFPADMPVMAEDDSNGHFYHICELEQKKVIQKEIVREALGGPASPIRYERREYQAVVIY